MDAARDNKLTIARVAELCGVSKTTVSRYLNGKYDNMSAETRERIAAVVQDLDYRPNRAAQRLKAQKAMVIGCVLADVSSPYAAILLRGIADACEQAGYQVLFSDSREDPARERSAIEGFLNDRVDGLLINTTGGNDALLNDLREKLPVVLVDRGTADGEFDDVMVPNFDAARMVTEKLLALGYDRVVFMTEPMEGITPRLERWQGYRAAMRAADREPELLELSMEDEEACIRALAALTARRGSRTALLCANGVAAMRGCLALQALKVEPGRDFGLCAFDDWPWLQLARPGTSTVRLATEEQGAAAARLLLGRIDGDTALGPEPQHILIPAQLILRGSTAAADGV